MTVKYLVLGTLLGAAGGATSVGLTFALLAGMPMPEGAEPPCVKDYPGQVSCNHFTPPSDAPPTDPLPALSTYSYQPYSALDGDVDSIQVLTLPDSLPRRFML